MGGEGCRVRRREGEGVITHMTRWGKREKKKSREDEEGRGGGDKRSIWWQQRNRKMQ